MSSSELLLAVDTSAAVSAAVHDGTTVLAARQVHDPRHHAELLVPMIDEVLRAAGADRRQVRAVAVGTGPGPFTGLRVGLVTARVLALALGVSVHGVPSLDALALRVLRRQLVSPGEEFVVATDARRREVYWGRYRAPVAPGAEPTLLRGPAVDRPGAVDTGGAACFGRGAVLYPELVTPDLVTPDLGTPELVTPELVTPEVLPRGPTSTPAALDAPHSAAAAAAAVAPLDASAAEVAELACRRIAAGLATPAEPLYLRRPDAVEPAARKRALS